MQYGGPAYANGPVSAAETVHGPVTVQTSHAVSDQASGGQSSGNCGTPESGSSMPEVPEGIGLLQTTGGGLNLTGVQTPGSALDVPPPADLASTQPNAAVLRAMAANSSDEDGSEPYRRVSKGGRKPRKPLTMEQVSVHFDVPLEEAARRLEVGPTYLRGLTRKLGLARWPYGSRDTRDFMKPAVSKTVLGVLGSSFEHGFKRSATDGALAIQDTPRIDEVEASVSERSRYLLGATGSGVSGLPSFAPASTTSMAAWSGAAGAPTADGMAPSHAMHGHAPQALRTARSASASLFAAAAAGSGAGSPMAQGPHQMNRHAFQAASCDMAARLAAQAVLAKGSSPKPTAPGQLPEPSSLQPLQLARAAVPQSGMPGPNAAAYAAAAAAAAAMAAVASHRAASGASPAATSTAPGPVASALPAGTAFGTSAQTQGGAAGLGAPEHGAVPLCGGMGAPDGLAHQASRQVPILKRGSTGSTDIGFPMLHQTQGSTGCTDSSGMDVPAALQPGPAAGSATSSAVSTAAPPASSSGAPAVSSSLQALPNAEPSPWSAGTQSAPSTMDVSAGMANAWQQYPHYPGNGVWSMGCAAPYHMPNAAWSQMNMPSVHGAGFLQPHAGSGPMAGHLVPGAAHPFSTAQMPSHGCHASSPLHAAPGSRSGVTGAGANPNTAGSSSPSNEQQNMQAPSSLIGHDCVERGRSLDLPNAHFHIPQPSQLPSAPGSLSTGQATGFSLNVDTSMIDVQGMQGSILSPSGGGGLLPPLRLTLDHASVAAALGASEADATPPLASAQQQQQQELQQLMQGNSSLGPFPLELDSRPGTPTYDILMRDMEEGDLEPPAMQEGAPQAPASTQPSPAPGTQPAAAAVQPASAQAAVGSEQPDAAMQYTGQAGQGPGPGPRVSQSGLQQAGQLPETGTCSFAVSMPLPMGSAAHAQGCPVPAGAAAASLPNIFWPNHPMHLMQMGHGYPYPMPPPDMSSSCPVPQGQAMGSFPPWPNMHCVPHLGGGMQVPMPSFHHPMQIYGMGAMPWGMPAAGVEGAAPGVSNTVSHMSAAQGGDSGTGGGRR